MFRPDPASYKILAVLGKSHKLKSQSPAYINKLEEGIHNGISYLCEN